MNYCYYKYADGICGVNEDNHPLRKTARSLHPFQLQPGVSPSPDVEVVDGKLVMTRDIEEGEAISVPIEHLHLIPGFLERTRP